MGSLRVGARRHKCREGAVEGGGKGVRKSDPATANVFDDRCQKMSSCWSWVDCSVTFAIVEAGVMNDCEYEVAELCPPHHVKTGSFS